MYVVLCDGFQKVTLSLSISSFNSDASCHARIGKGKGIQRTKRLSLCSVWNLVYFSS